MDQATVKSLVRYDPDTGNFFSARTGLKRGHCSVSTHGYVSISIRGKSYRAHRLAWLYMTGAWPNGPLDHVNRNRSDNRFSNLREVTNSENQYNRSPTKNMYGTGVAWFPTTKKFSARIRYKGKRYYLGFFDSPEDAAESYELAKHALHKIGGKSVLI